MNARSFLINSLVRASGFVALICGFLAQTIEGNDRTDVSPPTLVSGSASASGTTITLGFSERVDPITASNIANYTLSPALAVTAAVVNNQTVTLTTAQQAFDGTEYIVSVSNVEDLSQNAIAAGSKVSAYAFDTLRNGVARLSVWTGISGNIVQDLLGDSRYPNQPTFTAPLFSINSREALSYLNIDDYGAQIDAILTPTQSGSYRFFVSSDDSSRLFLSPDEQEANLEKIAEEPGCCNWFTEPDNQRTSELIPLTAGKKYAIRLIYKEGGGGDYGMVAWRREGDTTPASDLKPIDGQFLSLPVGLIVDPVGPFIQISPSPNAEDVSMTAPIVIAHRDGKTPWTAGNVTLKYDGQAVTPTITKEGNVLTIKYRPPAPSASLSVHRVSLGYLDPNGKPATYEYSFTVTAYLTVLDKVEGYPGLLMGAAALTPDAGGASGRAGDRGIDLTTSGGAVVSFDNTMLAKINAATTKDEITVAFWQKKWDISDSSAFALNSPSVDRNSMFRSHTPWSNQNIYFDTMGCCDGTTQRISADIKTFTAYSGDEAWWTEAFHHFVFTKKGPSKNIWIDGKLFLTGESTAPLGNDVNAFYMGAGGNGDEPSHAIMDEFAVFGKELGEADVVALAGGTSPRELSASKELLAYWDFNQISGSSDNTLPRLTGATNATIDEMVGYTQNLGAADSDLPAQPLKVVLVQAPQGLVVTNGVLSWTPTEAQGPSTNLVQVTVSDGIATVTNVFQLIVRETTDEFSSILWARGADMSMGRYSAGSAVGKGGLIYLAGGDNYTCTPLSLFEVYNPKTNQWAKLPDMPTGRWGLRLVAGLDGKIFALGGLALTGAGYCQVDAVALNECFDPATGKWTRLSPMQTPRYNFAGALGADGQIYVIGGRRGSDMFSTVEAYDPVTDRWQSRTSVPNGVAVVNAVGASNGKIYVIGAESNSFYEYNPSTDAWRLLQNAPDGPQEGAQIVELAPDHLLLRMDSPVRKWFEYIISSATWKELSRPDGQQRLMMAQVALGNVFAFGGWDAEPSVNGPSKVLLVGLIDSDKDGVPDDWETRYGFNPNDPADVKNDPDNDGFDSVAEYTAGTDPRDTTPPTLLGASAGIAGTSITVNFNEKIDPVTGGELANYSISPSIAVTAVSVQSNQVVLTTGAQDQSGLEYTVSVRNVRDLSKNVIAAGSSVGTYSYKRISRQGALRFSIWRGISGNELDRLLADPRYPSEPDSILALGSFNTREQFPDSEMFAPERENYGARIDGYLTPTESGEYRFFISSDDQSRLFVSTDDTEANLVQVAQETHCCERFTEPESPRTSSPIPLVAGQRYFVRFLYKEGCCGDYGEVAWRKEGDTTPAASLTPIPGHFLSTELLIDPQGAYTVISPKPNAVDVSPSAAIVIGHRDGTVPWTADNVTLKYDGQTVTPVITKQGDLLTIRYTPPVMSPSGVTHSVILGYLDPQGRPSTYEFGFTSRVYNRPVALAQSISTDEDLDASVMLTGSDLDGDGLTYSVVSQPKKGTLIGSGASLIYRPSANANGTDSFTFKVNDGTLDSEPATVSIVIAPVNDAPIALAGTFDTAKNVAKSIKLAVIDPDIPGSFSVVEGDFSWRQARTNAESRGGYLATFASQGEWELAKTVVGQRSLWIGAYQGENRVEPAGGWLWVTGEPWGFTAWGPGEPNNVGSEDFAHLIYTPMVNSPTWNDAPENSFYARSYLLEMPSAELNQGLTFTIVTGPSNGSLSGTPPNVTYTPNSGFVGSDTFTFKVGDGVAESAPATVAITVTDLNSPPVAQSLTKNVTGGETNLVTLVANDPEGSNIIYSIISQPTNGVLIGTPPNLRYLPNPNAIGTDAFTFKVNDGSLDSSTATVVLTIVYGDGVGSMNLNNRGLALVRDASRKFLVGTNFVAKIFYGSTTNNLKNSFAPSPFRSGTIANSGTWNPSAAGGPGTFGILTGFKPGMVTTIRVAVWDIQVFSSWEDAFAALSSGNSPLPTQVGWSDPFTYKIPTDPLAFPGGMENFPGLTLSPVPFVAITNSSPLAISKIGADSILVSKGVQKSIELTGSDPDRDMLTFTVLTQPTKGALSGKPPNLFYTANANADGFDSFTFKVNDGAIDSAPATISIRILGANSPPVALSVVRTNVMKRVTAPNWPAPPSEIEAYLNQFLVPLVFSGSDADGDPLTYRIISGPEGEAVLEKTADGSYRKNYCIDGSFEYPPTGSVNENQPQWYFRANFVKTYRFQFVVRDGLADSAVGNLDMVILPPPPEDKPPEAFRANEYVVIRPSQPQGTEAFLGTLVRLPFAGKDPEGKPLTYRIVSAPEGLPLYSFNGQSFRVAQVVDGAWDGSGAPTGPLNDGSARWSFPATRLGSYQFTYVVNDGSKDSPVATVNMDVYPVPAENRAPVALAGSINTAEDTSVPITLEGSDADGNVLTFSVVTPPTQGVLTGTAPNLTYTPNTNASGSDSFRFKVNDGYVDSPLATVTITIAPVADTPVARSSTLTTDEDVPAAIVLDVSDPDLPPVGVFTVVEGNFTWTQARTNAESRGGHLATFTSQAEWDRARAVVGDRSLWIGGYQGTSRVEPSGGWLWVTGEPWSFTAWGPGEPNNAGPEDYAHLLYTPLVNASTWNDAPVNFFHPRGYLLESPSDVTSGLTFTVVAPPTKGVLSGVAPNFTYTPNPDANGTDGFSFKVNDGTSDSGVATVAITIRAVNDAPKGEAQSLTLDEDSAVPVTLRGSDAEGDAVVLTVFSQPAKGILSGTPPNLTYTSKTNATGADAFVFKVDDGSLSSFATVSITLTPINDPPVALAQSVTLSEDATRTITLRGSDIDTPTANLFFTILTPPTKGSLVGTNGVYTYRPNAHANGSDGFTFKVSDGSADSAPATGSIDITPVNDAPIAVSQGVSTIEDSPVAVTLVGVDADSDPLAFSIVNQPANGSLSGTPPNLTYIPRTNFAGVDSFSFKVSDGILNSPTNGVVSITITTVNDAPVAVAQSVSTPKNTPRPVLLAAVDAENDALTYTVVAQPTRGALSGTAPVLTYTPELNFVGNDSFTFRARDGSADSAVVTVSIRVTASNVAPVALAQSVTVAEDTGAPVLLSATDADLDPLSFILVVGPTKGTLSGTPPNLVYLPNTNAVGADSFTFVANDGAVDSAPAAVSLTITPINDAPVAQSAAVSGSEDSVIPVLLVASDVDGDALEYTVVGTPTYGSLEGTPPNLSYIPPTNFNGTDSIRFKVRDGTEDSAVATVQLTVTPVNDSPILAPLAGSVLDAGVGLYFNAAGSDIDLPAQTLTFSLKSGPDGMAVSSSGSVSWLPTGSQRPSTNTVVLELTDGSATVAGSFVVVAKEASLVANFEGSAIDGYIAGATLWFDADLDGVVDPGEPQTVTDRQGDFVLNFDASLFDTNRNGKLDPSEGRIVAEGGVDLSSGQPRVGQLTAPAGSSVITPLTTMVDLVSREGTGLSVAVAEERVRTSLGIPAGISINSYDPVAAAVQGDQRAAAVQLAASTVADTVRLLASVVDGSSAGVDAQTSSAIVSQTLAKKMVAGTEVDLASPATVSSALSQAASAAGTSVSSEVANAVTAVVAGQNLAKESAVANAWNPLEALQSISQVQAVAQSSTANALGDLASGVVTTDEVLLVHTGTALSAAVAAAPVGDVTGTDRRAGTFTISTATAVVSEAGQVIQPLIIARQNGSFGSVRLLLRLEGDSDLLKTNSLLVEFADAVTQRTVDLASVLRDDLDPHLDRQLSASLALAPNAPTGAALGSGVSASIRVVDNDAAGSIGFVASTFRASEAGDVTVELRRVDGSAGRIQAVVRLFGGSALPVADYTNSAIATEFLPGQTRKRVSLGWIDDVIAESSETVNATLEMSSGSAPGAALLTGSTEAVVTVDDNDAANSAPVATGVAPGTTLTVVEGSSISITLQGSDSEGSTLTFTPVGVPSKGVLSGRSPSLSYKANLGARGTDSFTYKVNDGQLDSSLTTVTITIKPINLAPTATSQIVTTEEGRAVGLRLAGTDPDGDALTFRVTRAPSKGVLSGVGGELVYTPNAYASGTDSFLFRANDSKDESPDQTVWVVISGVNDAPVAYSQAVSGFEDQPLVITLTGNDPEGSSLTYTLVQSPVKGVLSGTGSRLIYLPSTNYHGADAFTFRVSDGSLSSALATVSVSILPVNDAPEAFGQTLAAVVGTPAPIVLTGRDLESDPLRFTVVRPPAQGTLSGIPPNLSYTAASGARGADSFTFKVGDGSLESAESTVAIQLAPENVAPSAVAQSVVVDEGSTQSINLTGVDPEGAPLTYSIVSAPAKGTLSGTAPGLIYTSIAGKTGADSFTFKVNDGFRDSALAVVSLDIRENQIPTASAQSVTLAEDTSRSIVLSGLDPEGKALTYKLVSPPSKGELSGTAPNLTYTPRGDVSGSDSFTFRVNDGVKDSVVALVNLTITEVNDAPVAVGFSSESSNRAPVTLQLVAKDVDSQVLTYSIVQEPKLGSLSGQAPNLVYTPRTNAFGTDSFAYTVSDGVAVSEPAVVTIPIKLPVTIPVALTQKLEAEDGVPLSIILAGTDTSGSPLTYFVDTPAFGTLTISGPNVVYTAKPGFRGRDVFGFRVSNGVRYSSSALVEVQVVAKRDKPPVFDAIANVTLDEGQSLTLAVKATDPEGAKLVYSLDRGPSGLTVSPTGALAWVPSEVQGPSTNLVVVGVDDGVNFATRRFTVIVREVNSAPEIDALAAVSIDPLVPWTLSLAAKDSDLPAQRLVFGLVQGPEGLSVSDTGRISWVPTGAQASKTHRVEVFVTDGTDRATAAFQLTVRAANTAPFFSNLTSRLIRELNPTSFRLVGRDTDLPAQQLTFGLVAGPQGLTVGTNGQVNWTPTEEQGPSTNRVVVRVSDSGVPALSTTNSFDLIVTEANVVPTFVNLTSRLIRELSPTSFRLVGRDSDLPVQLLTYSLVSGPSGLTVSPEGVVAWTPTEEQGPSTNAVTVRVSDNGSPALSTTSSFNLIVSEVNTAPTLINAFSRSMTENVKLTSQLIARDGDLPAQKLTFSLVSGPRGLTLSAGGLLEWTPAEDQGPSTNKVVVRVSDDAPTPASSTVTFSVTVREANSPPVFPGTNLNVAAQSKLAVALQATDSDLPAQSLSYQLEGGPAGLTISTNGLLEWTPAANLANTTNVVRVSVTDSQVRVQSTLRIVVGPVGSGTGSEAKSLAKAQLSLQIQPDQSMVLKLAGPAGARFRVESTARFGGDWRAVDSLGVLQTLGEDVPLLVPVPSDESEGFRQFRLVKE